MIAAAVIGTGVVAAAGAGAAITAGAGGYLYRRKKKKESKKKKARKEQAVFGQHLEEVTRLSDNELPDVFDFTITWLENHGLGIENLFSLSRSPIRAGELAKKYDTNKDEQKPDFEKEDPRDIALLLVKYLTDLPEPLCTYVLYEDFIQVEEEDNMENWIEAMRNQLVQLPDINLRVISRLTKFFEFYANEQEMFCEIPVERTVDSLSKSFGHLVFNTWELDTTTDNETSVSIKLERKLILNYIRIFSATGNKDDDFDLISSPRESSVTKFSSMTDDYVDDKDTYSEIDLIKKEEILEVQKSTERLGEPLLDVEDETDNISLVKAAPKPERKSALPPLPPALQKESDSSFLDLDTMSTPELTIVCETICEELGQVPDLKEKGNVRLSKRGSIIPNKPLPAPPPQ